MNYELVISEEASIRESVCELFYKNKPIQENLFGLHDLNEVLDEVFSVIKQGKPLYQRWVQKIDNKERKLSVPNKSLRKFLDSYLLDFIKKSEIHERCCGGEKGWNPKNSLETHIPCSCAFSFDLKSAFENLDYDKVYTFFEKGLENFPEKEKLTEFFSFLCTVKYSEKRGLPQGSSVSLALFNRILFPLDYKLKQKADERGFRYSRWVDDLTITSSESRTLEHFLGALELTERNFPISKEKVFFQNNEKIYLLGHKIQNNQVLKNSKEDRLREKCKPLDYEKVFVVGKKYESWD